MVEAEELERRLRTVRTTRGLSQQKVADALDLPRTAVSRLESAKRSVSTLELTRLSVLYLHPVSEFLQEGTWNADEDVLVELFRVAPRLEGDSSSHEQVARCVDLCREGVRLERLLGVAPPRSGPPSDEMPVPGIPKEAVTQSEQTAEKERRRLGIGNAPIADVSELIMSQGIWASGAEFPKGMSGLFRGTRAPDW